MSSILKISEAASLALHGAALLARKDVKSLSNNEIAKLLNASEHTVSKVMQNLVRGGLVTSARGPYGGFTLNLPAEKITLKQIYEMIEPPLDCQGCLMKSEACNQNPCILGSLVMSIHKQVNQYFSETSLAKLAANINIGR